MSKAKTPVVHIQSEAHQTTHTICGVRITDAVKLGDHASRNLCGNCRRLWPAEHRERARQARSA